MSTSNPVRHLAVAASVLSPGIHADDELLVEALREMRIGATPANWNDTSVDWSAFDAILVRSIWDYFQHYAQFLDWLALLDRVQMPTINPNEVTGDL